jgi:hypothetical protein
MESGRILYIGQRVAVLLAGLAIAVNGLTWLNIALTPVAVVCFLFVFPLFAGGLISYLIKASPQTRGPGWGAQNQIGRQFWNQILDGLSRWQRIGASVFAAYVFVNFFGTFAATSGSRENLMDAALQVRLITGHAALFLLVAAGLFRASRRLAKV